MRDLAPLTLVTVRSAFLCPRLRVSLSVSIMICCILPILAANQKNILPGTSQPGSVSNIPLRHVKPLENREVNSETIYPVWRSHCPSMRFRFFWRIVERKVISASFRQEYSACDSVIFAEMRACMDFLVQVPTLSTWEHETLPLLVHSLGVSEQWL